MRTKLAYCSARDQDVRIAWTNIPTQSGHANIPDSPEVVCLDYGEYCTGELCPMFGRLRILMAVRLARSGLREDWETIEAPCEGCREIRELQVLDDSHAYCPVCGTTNTWVLLEPEDEDERYVAVVPRDAMEGDGEDEEG